MEILSLFPNVIIQYSRKEANIVAYTLVRNSISFDFDFIYVIILDCAHNLLFIERIWFSGW